MAMPLKRPLPISCTMFAMLLVCLCLCCTPAPAQNHHSGPYPPNIAVWTAVQKQAQQQAGTTILQRIQKAAENNRQTVSIPEGHYRFAETHGPRPYHINLEDIQNMTINCNGSTFWFQKQATAFSIRRCTDFKLSNLVVDWDPLPFTQGTIETVHSQDNTIDVKLHDGYQRVTEKFRNGKGTLRGLLFDPQTRRIKPQQWGFCVNPFWDNQLPDGAYHIKVRGFYGKSVEEIGFETGDLIALWLRGGRTFRIEGCRRVTLQNVTLHASGFVSFVEAAGAGPNTYRNYSARYLPGALLLPFSVFRAFAVFRLSRISRVS